jgi:hypothetical protein
LQLKKLAEIVGVAFVNFYEPGDEIPTFDVESDEAGWEQEGSPPEEIIAGLIDAEPVIVEAMIAYLSSATRYSLIKNGAPEYYDSSTNYVEASLYGHRHFRVWAKFCQRIKHTRRFFDPSSRKFLDDIFKDIDKFSFGGAPIPVVTLDPKGKTITVYRARRAANGKAAKKILTNPTSELGPPPVKTALPGRMNPAGISVFYGAFNIDTCVAELRPPVGSLVVYGAFTVQEKLKLLDLSVFEKRIDYPSIFEEDVHPIWTRWKFLHAFHRQITSPVQPEDELFEYIPTQAVAEYIANVLKYDGIVYSSTQLGKRNRNIALFNVRVPSSKRKTDQEKSSEDLSEYDEDTDGYRPLLRYVTDSARVAEVSRAQYSRRVIDEEDLLYY